MIDAVAAQTTVSPITAQTFAPANVAQAAGSASLQGQSQSEAKSNVRLFIEQDPDTHTYVYRLVDAATGDVLMEIPREQLSTLANSGAGAAGGLIGTMV